jgi:dipeptidyl aminopeptidase/acylaminoacyl peptidase
MVTVILVLAITVPLAIGQGAQLRPVSIEDMQSIRNGFDAQISPDGRIAVFAVMEPPNRQSAQGPVSNVWIVSTDGTGAPVRLTAGDHMDWQPRWSPDGKRLAFLSNRQGSAQLYTLAMTRRIPVPLTSNETDVSDFAWSPDGRTIAILSSGDKEQTDYAGDSFPNNDEIILSRKVIATRLIAINVLTRRARPITTEALSILGFAWSPDGESLALLLPKSTLLQSFPASSADPARIATVHRAGGKPVDVAEITGALGPLRWSPDGETIGVLVHQGKAAGKIADRIAIVSRNGAAARYLPENYPGSIADFAWSAGRNIVFSGIEGARTRLHLLNLDSGNTAAAFREGAMEDISISGKRNRLVYFDESPGHPRDLWTSDLEGKSRQLTRLNLQIARLLFGKEEIIHWKARDGATIEGLLLRPVGVQPGQRTPLVVMPHGGVTGWSRWKFGFLTDVGQVMAAGHGFAVLYPNPRGTPGYGAGFEDELVGDVGGVEITDILSGVDFLVEQGVADPQRLGIGGWSWGGTIAVSAISQTDRFRCAIDGGGIVDWISFFGQTDSPAIATSLFGGTPLDRPDLYKERSPIFHLSNVTTPLLVLHGEMDSHVPTGQAWEVYRLLQTHGKNVEFVLYPREKEYLLEPSHAFNFMSRVIQWYEHYLKDNVATSDSQEPRPCFANSR